MCFLWVEGLVVGMVCVKQVLLYSDSSLAPTGPGIGKMSFHW